MKIDLTNDYILRTDQYLDTLEKAVNLLSNYQAAPKLHQMRAQPREDGIAFMQRAGRGCGRGRGRRGSVGGRGSIDRAVTAVNGNASNGDAEHRTNSAGESHCYNCSSTDGYWAYESPQLDTEQQAQLQINFGGQDEEDDNGAEDAHKLLQAMLIQGSNNKDLLNNDQAYLHSCSTVNAFKNSKLMSNIQK